MNYDSWIHGLRDIRQEENSPLQLVNGVWKVRKRRTLWNELAPRIFDTHLDHIKQFSVKILTELDPQFEMPIDERYAASIHGKNLKHSSTLRKGIAETLALLGCYNNRLKNCSQFKAEQTASLAVREILDTTDWQIWAGLNDLLPLLSEASPGEFLRAIENGLVASPCPFDSVFKQEGNSITGGIYITGMLWALESLAWSEEYLSRVAVILADLATHDPGGTWSNRPSNSLSTIFLPWLPQTLASVNKRISALKAVQLDFPDIAWQTVIKLLPNQHQTSTGSHKPTYRNIFPDNWEHKVTNDEYWEQITAYAEMAVDMASKDIDRLKELVSNLDNLPKPSFDALLAHVSSGDIVELPEEQRLPIWTNLISFIDKHRRYADAKWALDEDVITEIDNAANALAPKSPEGIYKRLFSSRDFDLYEENGDWKEEAKKLELKRQCAIKDLMNLKGLQGVLDFLDIIEAPNQVGYALGNVANEEIDSSLLPEYLDTERHNEKQFIGSYVWARYLKFGWAWVNELNRSEWTKKQQCQMLVLLPFEKETWNYAKTWLGKSEDDYWKKVTVNPYQSESDLTTAIEKLLSVSRPQPAIGSLYFQLNEKIDVDIDLVVKALLDAVSAKETSTLDSYHIIELIQFLQNNSEVSPEDLFNVEWAYLRLLDRHSGAEPKYLEKRLATEPLFFCELIQLIYRSKNEAKPEGPIDEKKKAIAANAWHLLHEWRRPPGLLDNGSFSDSDFKNWLSTVKAESTESGRYEVAMIKVGEVLFYSPEDSEGLWINQVVARALNERDAEDLRSGFRTEVYNSRGTHWVDPTGKPERELAEQWNEKASALEDAGFARFAATLRDVAKSYNQEAEQVVLRHARENDANLED